MHSRPTRPRIAHSPEELIEVGVAGGSLTLSRAAALCATCALMVSGSIATAQDAETTDPPTRVESADGSETVLSGKEIYEKVLDNRFDSYTQNLVMNSGDRGGNIQATTLGMKYLNFRKEDKKIVSKSIMKYYTPQDVRHLGYLVINKVDGSEDQFVYRPSSRRVRRINLRGEAVFGTDFAFEDIIPQELEDATYERKPDSELEGVPVYVVEVTPVEQQDSEYSKFDVYVSRDHFVALKVDYWDQDHLHIKELRSEPTSITSYSHEQADGPKTIWIAKSQKIRHLKLDTWTELEIEDLDPTVKLRRNHFSERELARGN